MTPSVKPENNLNRPVLAVGAVVFKEQKVLLVKRGNPPAKGMWAIPGGRVNLGETIQQAAEREVLEETGIRIKANEPIYSFEVIDRDDFGNILFHYYIVDFDGEYQGGQIQAGDDADQARWVSEKDLEQLQLNLKTRELLSQKYAFG
jgi:8-oxo-dGTP diphosphatase